MPALLPLRKLGRAAGYAAQPLRYDEAVRSVTVNLPANPYAATIEPGLLKRAGEFLRAALPGCTRYFIITVAPVRKAWARTLTASLTASGLTHTILEMPDGERAKTLRAVGDLATKLVRRGADRRSAVIAFGGGVVGDVAAFVASIYMRGIDVVQIPTTFLAQVDASIGGKTGVDLPEGKNLLGTFHQPRAVLIDPAVLSTLAEREFRSGLYEALKCGIIRRRDIFDFMEQNRERILRRDPAALEWLIAECVQVKAEVVAADERESGLRRILNFGHTIGHALEAETGYKHFLHGEAVAWGMIAACKISAAMRLSDSETTRRIISSIFAYAVLPKVEPRGKRIARRLAHDKKTTDGVVHFVLPIEVGKVQVVSEVPERAVIQAVEEIRSLSQA